MPLYMTQFAYTPESWAALTQDPVDRSQAVSSLAESMGGRMVAFYNSFGEYDGLVISEAPDNVTAAAIAMVASSPGHIKALKTTVLLTAEEGIEAMRKAGEVTFRGPQQQ